MKFADMYLKSAMVILAALQLSAGMQYLFNFHYLFTVFLELAVKLTCLPFQVVFYQGRRELREVHRPRSLMLPVAPSSACHPTLCRVPEEEMVEMGCQDAMVGMELQGDREKGETLVYRDHLDHKVCNLIWQDEY